jgi:hypothetical protein
MTGSITSTSGYSALEVTKPNYLSWPILKAYAQNRAGEVVLRSADPLDRPLINFRTGDEGSDTAGEDLQSAVAGIRSRASKAVVKVLPQLVRDLIAARRQRRADAGGLRECRRAIVRAEQVCGLRRQPRQLLRIQSRRCG